LEDKGKSVDGSHARTRATTRARAPSWASDDVLPALSRRAAELEALATSLQADLDAAQRRLAAYSEFDQPLQDALVDAYHGAQTIQLRAREDADSTLERALDERRLLSKDVDRLRGERDHLTNEIVFARRGGLVSLPRVAKAIQQPSARDHRLTLSTEMRLILRALFEESFGPRPPVAPTPTAPPRTLLRAGAAAPRRRPASTATSKTTPAPVTHAIVRTLVEDPRPAEAARLPSEISDTIDAPAKTAAAIVESPSPPTLSGPEPIAELTTELFEETREIVAELETTEIGPSGELFDPVQVAPTAVVEVDAVESVDAVQALAAVEAVEAIEAVENIEPAHAPMPYALPETTSELAPEHVTSETMPPVADGARELVSEVNISADPILEVTSMAHVTPEALPLPSPAPEAPQPTTPISTDWLTELWDTAVTTATPGTEVVPPVAAPLVSPAEMRVEPALPESQSADIEEPMLVAPSLPHDEEVTAADPVLSPQRAVRQLQLVLSPIDSFPELLEIQGRIAALSSVQALRLRDFRGGVATFVAGVVDALSGREFGASLQMLATLRLRMEGATDDSVELHVEPAP
jgi:hypothetical protein